MMVKVSQSIIDAMLEHARSGFPFECCGLLAGRDALVSRMYKLTNMLKSETRYQVDSSEHFAAVKDMRRLGIELLAVFHSHPVTLAYPSETDVKLAFYPEIDYMIISLTDIKKPVIRSFRIEDGIISEREIVVLADE